MANHQRPKIQVFAFVRKSATFILKENEKMVERTFVKFEHSTLRPSCDYEVSQDNNHWL
jgi:hypothetical protein